MELLEAFEPFAEPLLMLFEIVFQNVLEFVKGRAEDRNGLTILDLHNIPK